MTSKKTTSPMPISPLAPKKFAKLPAIAGIEVQAMAIGC